MSGGPDDVELGECGATCSCALVRAGVASCDESGSVVQRPDLDARLVAPHQVVARAFGMGVLALVPLVVGPDLLRWLGVGVMGAAAVLLLLAFASFRSVRGERIRLQTLRDVSGGGTAAAFVGVLATLLAR